MQGSYALGFAAGLVAALNPCGFAMLPAYLGLVVGTETRAAPAAAIRRALVASAAMTIGFVLVFGSFGLVVVPLGLTVQGALPWVTVVVGALLVLLGAWLLSGREMLVAVPRMGRLGPGSSTWSMLGYGIAYAVASLSCTIGPFLAITSTTFTDAGVLEGVGVFVAYAIGMGVVVTALAVAVALARGTLVGRLRQLLPYVSRASGALLVLAGLYVALYGWFELRVLGGGSADDPVVGTAIGVQSDVVRWVQRVPTGWWLALAALLVVLAVAAVRRTRRSPTTADDPDGADGAVGANPESVTDSAQQRP